MTVEKRVEIRHRLEIVFKIWFYIYVILSTCNLTYGQEIVSVIMWPMLVLGAVLVLERGIHVKEYWRMPQLWALILLFLSYLLSLVANLQYESKGGLVTMVFWVFYFGLLYTFHEDDSRERVEREFKLMAVVHIVYVLIMTVISLSMMAVGYSKSYIDVQNGNYEVCAGFHDGRLWGAFQDPNLGAVVCCTAIVLSIYFMRNTKKKQWKVILGICIALFLTYIAFSDSRNGLVSLCIGISGYVFFCMYHKDRRIKKQWKNVMISLALGVLCMLVPEGIKFTYNIAVEHASEQEQKKDDTKTSIEKAGNDKHIAAPVERNYSMEGDVSNRRFDIWCSGIEVGLSRPFTGTSFTGIVPYAKENMPDTYIVNNDHWDYSTMDNEIINIFVSQGFPGIISLLFLISSTLLYIFRRIWKQEKEQFALSAVLLTCVLILSVSAMFQATMFYQNSANANMFWMFLGYLIFLLKYNIPKKKITGSDKNE